MLVQQSIPVITVRIDPRPCPSYFSKDTSSVMVKQTHGSQKVSCEFLPQSYPMTLLFMQMEVPIDTPLPDYDPSL